MAASWSPSSIIWWLFTMGPFPLPPGTSVDFFVALCAETCSEIHAEAQYAKRLEFRRTVPYALILRAEAASSSDLYWLATSLQYLQTLQRTCWVR
jgi:hypothetical protein